MRQPLPPLPPAFASLAVPLRTSEPTPAERIAELASIARRAALGLDPREPFVEVPRPEWAR